MKSGLDECFLFLFPQDPFQGRLVFLPHFMLDFDALGLGSIVTSSVLFRDFSLKY